MKNFIAGLTLLVGLVTNTTQDFDTRQQKEAQQSTQSLRERLGEGELSETAPTTVLNELREYIKVKEECKIFLTFIKREQTSQYKELNKALYDICMKKELDKLQKYEEKR